MDLKKQVPDSMASADQMISLLQAGDVEGVKNLRKKFILDSFAVSRFHSSYKDWENSKSNDVINNTAPQYNEMFTQVSRINDQVDRLAFKWDRSRESIKFDDILISRKAVIESQLFDDNLVELKSYTLDDLFSLEREGGTKLEPKLQDIKRLLNIEFRIRLEKRVQHGLLLSVKAQLAAKSKKWVGRTSQLDDFMRDFDLITEEVERIRQNEKEDLDYTDEEIEDDEDDEVIEDEGEDETVDAYTEETKDNENMEDIKQEITGNEPVSNEKGEFESMDGVKDLLVDKDVIGAYNGNHENQKEKENQLDKENQYNKVDKTFQDSEDELMNIDG